MSVNVLGLTIEHPLMNAAGTCKLLHDAKELARSGVSVVMIGSITIEPRDGNSGNVFWSEPMFSLNSLGLPNQGAGYYKENLPLMVRYAHDNGKPLFVSVAGFSPAEYGLLAELAFEGGADVVELNLSCPNVWQGSEQKPIACFVPELVEEILANVLDKIGMEQRVAVKTSPYSDPMGLIKVAQVVAKSPLVKAVTTSNTFPNARLLDETGTARISGAGFGGLSGPPMKPMGLGQVEQWRSQLPNDLHIFGVGGVSEGQDVIDYLRCGATLVQVATAYLQREDKNVFSRILSEYVQIEEV